MGAGSSLIPTPLAEQESWCGACSSDKLDEEIGPDQNSRRNHGNGRHVSFGRDVPINVPGEQIAPIDDQNPNWSMEERRVVSIALTANPAAMHNRHARRTLFENLKINGYLDQKTMADCEQYGNYLAIQAVTYRAYQAADHSRHRAQKTRPHPGSASRGAREPAAM